MSGLSFLKNITLQPNSLVKQAAAPKTAVAKNPTTADLRVYRSGAVYPSAKLVTACMLEFVARDSDVETNGFDIFSSKDFINTKTLAESFLFIAMVPKSEPKVDLFGSTVYEKDGSPKADVLTQGAVTFGKELLELIESAYGITLKEGQNYIDLKIVQDDPFTLEDGIYWVPKKVSRGEKKGQVTLVRREDLTLYALAPVQLLGEDEAPINVKGGNADDDEGNLEAVMAGIDDDTLVD